MKALAFVWWLALGALVADVGPSSSHAPPPQDRAPAFALPGELEAWARSRSRRPMGDPVVFERELNEQIRRFSAELEAMEVSLEYLVAMVRALAAGDAAEHQRQRQLGLAELRERAAELARSGQTKEAEAGGRELGCTRASAECPD